MFFFQSLTDQVNIPIPLPPLSFVALGSLEVLFVVDTFSYLFNILFKKNNRELFIGRNTKWRFPIPLKYKGNIKINIFPFAFKVIHWFYWIVNNNRIGKMRGKMFDGMKKFQSLFVLFPIFSGSPHFLWIMNSNIIQNFESDVFGGQNNLETLFAFLFLLFALLFLHIIHGNKVFATPWICIFVI